VKKFIFITDLHYGHEIRNGNKVTIHDPAALGVVLSFVSDFKPNYIILGGDILDCGAISHHDRHKPGAHEGLRVFEDAQGCNAEFIKPLEEVKNSKKIFITGNHEDWLNDVVDELPGLQGIVSIKHLLKLKKWQVIPQGGHYSLNKLTFLHGDQLSNADNIAKAAVLAYERNVRFGHFHTFQAFAKTSAIDVKLGKTGMCVPCLCVKNPRYTKGNPNKWLQGFLYGYIDSTWFNDYPVIITDGKACIEGKVYK
jgi:hypothetical protein